jgi:hypothetical protein
MTRSFSLILLAAALGLASVGCTRDCEDNCEDTKDCVGADKSIDCAANCEEARELNEDAGCEDEYDSYLNCTNQTDDICTAGDSCESEANKWNDCLVKYCSDPENTEKCQ